MASLSSQSRLSFCWALSDCRSCLYTGRCGWCASSNTCVPASNLLAPLTHPNICPLREERYELRTKALGCGCSTTTLLSVIVTVFATLVAAVVVYYLVLAILGLDWFVGTGNWRGTEMERKEGGGWEVKEWKRPGVLGRVRRLFPKREGGDATRSEQERLTERTRLLG